MLVWPRRSRGITIVVTTEQPRLEPFRIAITGASGILGSAIADRLEATADQLCRPLGLPIQVLRISRRLGSDLFKVTAACDVIIHCAATPYEPGTYSDYEILSSDLELTLRALRMASAQKKPPRFIYLSSIMVYEKAPGTAHDRPLQLVETDVDRHPAPAGAIGLSKMMSEAAIRAWSKSTGGMHTIWRLNNVVAPHEPYDQPGHIVTDLYRKLFIERVPELHLAGGGFQVRAFSWFEDVVSGIVDLMANPATDNQTFNLGSDQPTAICELARVMAALGAHLGMFDDYKPVVVINSGGERHDVRVPSILKARALLGWSHVTSLHDMIEKFLHAKAKAAGVTVRS